MDERPDLKPGDEAPPETPAAGQQLCPDCSGKGERGGDPCPTCAGSGYVEAGIGGG